jgi:hypothetical protein
MSQYYYRVKIGTKYMTLDGLSTGKPLLLTVSGVDQLRKTVAKTTTTLADGSLDIKTFDFNVTKPFEIEVQYLPKTIGEYLLAAYNNSSILNVIGTQGETGDFNVNAEVIDLSFKDFRKDAWKNVVIKLATA